MVYVLFLFAPAFAVLSAFHSAFYRCVQFQRPVARPTLYIICPILRFLTLLGARDGYVVGRHFNSQCSGQPSASVRCFEKELDEMRQS